MSELAYGEEAVNSILITDSKEKKNDCLDLQANAPVKRIVKNNEKTN